MMSNLNLGESDWFIAISNFEHSSNVELRSVCVDDWFVSND